MRHWEKDEAFHLLKVKTQLSSFFLQIIFKEGQAKQAGHAGQSGFDFSPELGEAFDSLAPKQAGASFLPFGMYLKYSLATIFKLFCLWYNQQKSTAATRNTFLLIYNQFHSDTSTHKYIFGLPWTVGRALTWEWWVPIAGPSQPWRDVEKLKVDNWYKCKHSCCHTKSW